MIESDIVILPKGTVISYASIPAKLVTDTWVISRTLGKWQRKEEKRIRRKKGK